eukprot:SAG22_NODE_15696_length_343_cov_0.668033_1_plen_77_part_10
MDRSGARTAWGPSRETQLPTTTNTSACVHRRATAALGGTATIVADTWAPADALTPPMVAFANGSRPSYQRLPVRDDG